MSEIDVIYPHCGVCGFDCWEDRRYVHKSCIKELKAKIVYLEACVIENCRLCKWRECSECPTKSVLDSIEGGTT